jgi:RNA polymerase sigma factor (sigma-70 family)
MPGALELSPGVFFFAGSEESAGSRTTSSGLSHVFVDKSFTITKIGSLYGLYTRICGASWRMHQRSESEDQALIVRCLDGSEDAWKEFYARFVGLIRAVVRKCGRPGPADVEDLTQATFLALATALHNYDVAQSLPKFVCLVAQRVAIDEYRKTRAVKRDGEALVSVDGDEDAVSPFVEECERQDERLERAELEQRLRSALSALDVRCRDLITLRYFRELSFKEIADLVGASENTVTVQTRRCLSSLRAKFNRLG